jgi:hypothetical protein
VTAFFDLAANMLRFFEGWDTHVPHEGEKGGVRERRVRDFFAEHLPGKYGVASGHIIDRTGAASLQEDVVIFDRLGCPTLRADQYYHIFPCESVYATVEVKSKLTTSEIDACVKHTHRLRSLFRGDGGGLGPIESFVFAYDSYDIRRQRPAEWALDKLRDASLAYEQPLPVPSLVLCLKKKFLLHLGGPDGRTYGIAEMLDSGVLLYYFEKVLHRLSEVQTSSTSLFTQYGWERDNPIWQSPEIWNLKTHA